MSDAFFHGARVVEVDTDAGILANAVGGGLGAPSFHLSVSGVSESVAPDEILGLFTTNLADAELELLDDAGGRFALDEAYHLLAGEASLVAEEIYTIRVAANGPTRRIVATFAIEALAQAPGEADFGQDGNPLITIL